MTLPTSTKSNDLKFRPFLPWFLVKNALMLGVSAYCLMLAVRSGQRWWLAGLALASAIELMTICRYYAQRITLRDFTLICRRGMFRVRENSFPLVRIDLEIAQSVLGRLFDYGTVRLATGGETITLYQVALVSELRAAVAKRQNELMLLLVDRRTFVRGHSRGRDRAA